MQAKDIVRDYVNAWNRRDSTGIVGMLASDGTYFDVPMNKKLSGGALRRFLARNFVGEKLHYDVVGEVLIGERTVAFQYETFRIDDPDDATAWLSGAEFLTMHNGQVTGIEDYYKQPAETKLRGSSDRDATAESAGKYRKSGLRQSQVDAYKRALIRLMEVERLYRDADLTLPMLASRMNCSTNYLSQVINGEFEHGFYEFLNCYRIEEAKFLLDDNAAGRVAIGRVSATVGFKSNSAFYAAFKRYCRQTPSQYRRQTRRARK